VNINMGGEVVTVTSPGTAASDPYSGEPDISWDPDDVTERDVQTVAPPEPRPSGEPTQDARNAVTDGWTLYLPPNDPVTRLDRVTVRAVTYPVQGEPARWDHSTIVQAFRTEG
jgi:hypothetical protein